MTITLAGGVAEIVAPQLPFVVPPTAAGHGVTDVSQPVAAFTITTPAPAPVVADPPQPSAVDVHGSPRVYLSGAASSTVLAQNTPAAWWSWPNPFGALCNVTVYTPTGEQVEADVTVTPTLITVMFPEPTSGAVAAS